MAISLLSPDNSFIQFVSVNEPSPIPGISCGQAFTTCLPITEDDDYAFQFYVEGELATVLQDNYVVRLRTEDEEVVSGETVTEWFYDSVANKTWGNNTIDFNLSDFIEHGGCFNFIVSKKAYNYDYDLNALTYPDNMTFSLVIDGVSTSAGGGAPITSILDIITVIQTFLGADAVVQQSITGHMNIQATGGHVYGSFVVVTSGPSFNFTPTPQSFLVDEYISNCLQYVESTCFTRVVKYKGNENQFGFNYALDPTFYNSVRLPVWIEKPVPIIDENYFLLSDGTKKVLSARYEKEYDGHTEYFDEDNHFRFLAAMKHDTFLLDGAEYSAEGKYDIGWITLPGSPILNAPASFKVRPNPFFQQNSNCVNV